MKRVGYILLIVGILLIIFYFIRGNLLEKNNIDNINDYINETSIQEISEDIEIELPKETKNNISTIKYTAVIEIPKINLKRGVVDSTKSFKSINYAISVDNSSNYPNEYGNFILYAHSGNSNIAYFRNLYKVEINDDIYVYYNGIKYHYIIVDKYDIEKTGKAKVIKTNNDNYITLITCNQAKKGYQIVFIGQLIDSFNY